MPKLGLLLTEKVPALDMKSQNENDISAELTNLAQDIISSVHVKDVMELKYMLIKFIDLAMKYKTGE